MLCLPAPAQLDALIAPTHVCLRSPGQYLRHIMAADGCIIENRIASSHEGIRRTDTMYTAWFIRARGVKFGRRAVAGSPVPCYGS